MTGFTPNRMPEQPDGNPTEPVEIDQGRLLPSFGRTKPGENPMIAHLPPAAMLADTNDSPKAQGVLIQGIADVVEELVDLALADDFPEGQPVVPETPMKATLAIALAAEEALLRAYGDYPDVLARVIVTSTISRQVKALRNEGPVVHGTDGIDVLIRALTVFLDTAHPDARSEEIASDIRADLIEAAEPNA